jgi:hypothetical protein
MSGAVTIGTLASDPLRAALTTQWLRWLSFAGLAT